MVATVRGVEIVDRVLKRFYPTAEFDYTRGFWHLYRFSTNIRAIRRKKGTKYQRDDEVLANLVDRRTETLYGIRVLNEASWNELTEEYNKRSRGLKIFENSVLDHEELDPEEEFLRNYKVVEDGAGHLSTFIETRAKIEMQIYGDLPMKIWFIFVEQLCRHIGFETEGLAVMKSFLSKYGTPFHQGLRDLSKLDGFRMSYSTPMLFEMSCMESLLEINIFKRMQEEKIRCLQFGNRNIDPIALLREFYLICLPHPKRINNILRSPYSWFVKTWGVAADPIVVLKSSGGDDRNSKDVYYEKFQYVENSYVPIFDARFYQKSLEDNVEKVNEAIEYSRELGQHDEGLPIFMSMLKDVYRTPFVPNKPSNLILASFMLSIQTITGYGRAWVKNVGTDFGKQKRPSKDNFIERVSDYTANNFIAAYEEARQHHEDIVFPEDLYTSMLRLARNTSSGFSTSVKVRKAFGPNVKRKPELIDVTSRIKALVIFTKGHTVFTPEELNKRYNTTTNYQTKGSREVPIKATRTIYSINLSVLVPQLVVTLPLNEYFARVGGSTSPYCKKMGGKIIVGDLEATGSRVMDAADTFRNSADPGTFTLAIDYSEYDTHLTRHNFRGGMIKGLRAAMAKYRNLRYEGYSLDELIDFGYGDGRVAMTLWNGKRRVFKVPAHLYIMLNEDDRKQGDFKPPPGVRPVTSMAVAKKLIQEKSITDDYILVSPTDGSDLALIDTHLSGENSTLIANSMHNMAIGTIIQEEVLRKYPTEIAFQSEQYVGDDTLLYTQLLTRDPKVVNGIIETTFTSVEKCGHEASASKTMVYPYSVEKTQTHAKQGVYVPQDRMMIISSERRKDIENVNGYMRSQVHTMVTKVSRGFSHDLAQWILMLKTVFVGAWKLKRTIKDVHGYRDRKFDDDAEDGFTLVTLKNPLALHIPQSWGGYGAHPAALNIVMTEEMFIDSMQMSRLEVEMQMLTKVAGKLPPAWDETQADKRQISAETKMSFFSKMARPAVRATLMVPEIMDVVETLPLGDFGPGRLSKTMMHSALLKEANARSLLVSSYELEYQKQLNGWRELPMSFTLDEESGYVSSKYAKMFDIYFDEEIIEPAHVFPDQNLSPQFYVQKAIIGQRKSTRMRMSYIDRIDSILRKDVVMRGFLTANTIVNVLEKVGISHTAVDLVTLFTLMNIEVKVAEELAEYITSERVRFDAVKLLKKGIVGDEFSMSLDVATQDMIDQLIRYPHELTKTELDAVSLYVSQLIMLRAALGMKKRRIRISISSDERERFRAKIQRYKTHTPKLKLIKKLIDINRLSVRALENQFV
ncbi:VP1 [Eubenangee virus]|uniref:RNA-directed RNA polymerase n=2 Tax=Eubenangee virus TaxID=40056 RepID=H9ZXR2_9REOV|nr:VP1 [Eubenangee virus]AFH41509.1 VP1 [Eubenangee virus]